MPPRRLQIPSTPVPAKHLKCKLRRHVCCEQIAAFVTDKIAVKERNLIVEHLAGCARCRKLVSKVVHSQGIVKDPIPRSR